MFKLKRLVIVTVILVSLGVCEIIGVLPYVVARITASIYVTINYPTKGLKFRKRQKSRHLVNR
jgi:hypothetical protein